MSNPANFVGKTLAATALLAFAMTAGCGNPHPTPTSTAQPARPATTVGSTSASPMTSPAMPPAPVPSTTGPQQSPQILVTATPPVVHAGETVGDHPPDATVASLNHQIAHDIPALMKLGIQVVRWGPNASGTREDIFVYKLTQQDATDLAQRYGGQNILAYNSTIKSITPA